MDTERLKIYMDLAIANLSSHPTELEYWLRLAYNVAFKDSANIQRAEDVAVACIAERSRQPQ